MNAHDAARLTEILEDLDRIAEDHGVHFSGSLYEGRKRTHWLSFEKGQHKLTVSCP